MGFEQQQAWYQSWSDVRDADIERVTKLLRSGTLSVVQGGILERFERSFARFAGVRHALATCNGTAALYAALWAVGVRRGDEVAVCDYGFHGMAAAIVALGAVAVPVDVEAQSLGMDADDLARAIGPRTRAVLIHNPWGVPANYAALREAAGELPLISDASHAHGALVAGEPLAKAANITCFSLGAAKLITGGELGVAVTDDPLLRARMLVFGHTNRAPKGMPEIAWDDNCVGLKLRPHPVALTLAAGQLERFPEKFEKLTSTCAELERGLAAHGLRPQAVREGDRRSYWKLVFELDEQRFAGIETARVEAALRGAGVPVEDNHYWPPLSGSAPLRWPDHQAQLRARACPRTAARVPRLVTLPAPVELASSIIDATITAAAGII